MSHRTGSDQAEKVRMALTRECAVGTFQAGLLLVLSNQPTDAHAQSLQTPDPKRETLQVVDRPYGLQLGDLVTRTVAISGAAAAFAPERLPEPGPISDWLFLRSVDIATDSHQISNGASDSTALRLIYQITAAAPTVTLVDLPVLELFPVGGDDAPSIARLDAVPVSVSPIIGERPFQRLGLGDLQRDALVPITPRAQWLALMWTMVALAISLCVAQAIRLWWRQRPDQQTPFVQASLALRAPCSISQAYQHLHRAFDRAAKQSMMLDDIPTFISLNPAFEQLEADIQQFFEASREQFFKQSGGVKPEPGTTATQSELATLREIANALARVEKRLA